jgi:tetratricopeptide (TPR) repeat protein
MKREDKRHEQKKVSLRTRELRRRAQRESAARASSIPPRVASAATLEALPAQLSERPVTLTALETDVDENVFFERPTPTARAAVEPIEPEWEIPSRRSAHTEARRLHAMPYVGVAVVTLALLGALGVVRNRAEEPASVLLGTALLSGNALMRPGSEAIPSTLASGPPRSETDASKGAADPGPQSPAQLTLIAGESLTAGAAENDELKVDAKAEKRKAQQALERGKVKEAIAHATQSTEADPTDGEAWLLLGAALQEGGNFKAAREAYGKCVKQGTRGPRHECRALLQ